LKVSKVYTTDVVIAAAGRGKRVGAAQNKLLLNLNQNSDRDEKAGEDKLFGKNVTTLLEYGLKTFQEHPGIRNIFLVVSKEDFQILQPWAEEEGFFLVEGGERRQDSVHKALEHIYQHDELPDMVLIHDGARIFCTTDLIDRILHVCRENGSAIPVIPIHDTVRRIRTKQEPSRNWIEKLENSLEKGDLNCELLDRNELFAVQTPQGFRFEDLWEASLKSCEENWDVTDDASMLEKMGKSVHPVPGEMGNLKITTAEDLDYARHQFQSSKL